MEEFYLDNDKFTKTIDTFDANGKQLVFDKSLFNMSSNVVGTQSMAKLLSDSKLMVQLTDDYRSFICAGVVPSLRVIQLNFNEDAENVAASISNTSKSAPSGEDKTSSDEGTGETISALSEYDYLLLYDPTTGKYNFEVLLEKCRDEGYKLTDSERAAIVKIFEDFFGVYDQGKVPTAYQYDVQCRLLKMLVKHGQIADISSNYTYVTNEELVYEIMDGISDKESMAYMVLANFNVNNVGGAGCEWAESESYNIFSVSIKRTDAGIITSYTVDMAHNNDATPDQVTNTATDDATGEIGYSISLYTGRQYVYNNEKQNPNTYSHEYGLIDSSCRNRDSIARMYMSVTNTTDYEIVDGLMKADNTYDGVFDVDPTNASGNVAVLLAEHSRLLSDDKYASSGYAEYQNFANSAVSNNSYNKKYIELISAGAVADAETIYMAAWGVETEEEEQEIIKAMNSASRNELFWLSLNEEVNLARNKHPLKKDITISFKVGGDSSEFDFWDNDTYVIRSGDKEKEISLHDYERDGSGAIAAAGISNINDKKAKVERETAVSQICTIIGVGNSTLGKVVEAGINGVLDYNYGTSNFGTSAANAASGAYSSWAGGVNGRTIGAGVKLIQLQLQYDAKMEALNKEMDDLADLFDTSILSSVMTYEIGGTQYYYTRVNYYPAIKAMKDWDHGGLDVIYGEGAIDTFKNILIFDGNLDDNVEAIYSTLNYGDEETYSRDMIENALKAVIYGCDNQYYLDNPMYKSISDIPAPLRAECITLIDNTKPGRTQAEKEKYHNSVETQFSNNVNQYTEQYYMGG